MVSACVGPTNCLANRFHKIDKGMKNSVCPVPVGKIAILGSYQWEGESYFALWKDQQMIVVQINHSVLNREWMHSESRPFSYGEEALELIHQHILAIDFGRSNWVYLVKRGDGTHQMIHRDVFVRGPAPVEPWVPNININEITFTRWVWGPDDREGVWNNRPVHALMGWAPLLAGTVYWESCGQQHLKGLDLTFEVLGHITDNGRVVGLLTEKRTGRMVQYCDKSKVYSAIATIQQRGLIYAIIERSNMMVTDDGKLRLLNLSAIEEIEDPERLDVMAEVVHWERLIAFFKELETEGNPIPTSDQVELTPVLLTPIFPPEKGLIPPGTPEIMSLVIWFYRQPKSRRAIQKADRRDRHKERHTGKELVVGDGHNSRRDTRRHVIVIRDSKSKAKAVADEEEKTPPVMGVCKYVHTLNL